MQSIPWWRTNFGDESAEAASASIRAERISMGGNTEEFEEHLAELLGVRYAVATTSGSMAILMAMIAAGIGNGDEVIIPNRTWIATAHAAYLLGAKPVFVDVLPDIPKIDAKKIEEKISKKTRAIVPVHMNGRACDMLVINELASNHKLIVIEDAAQALFSMNEHGFLGTQSFAGCYSLSMAKLISTGQGGIVVTNSKDVYSRLRLLRTHGVESVMSPKFSTFGFNFRYNDVLAAVGLSQLRRRDEYIFLCNSIYAMYEKGLTGLDGVALIEVDVAKGELPIYIEITCSNRNRMAKYLLAEGVETRFFYPSMNMVDYFEVDGDFINSDFFAQNGLYLPCGPGQNLSSIQYTIDKIRSYSKFDR